jgi:hypothetical protein
MSFLYRFLSIGVYNFKLIINRDFEFSLTAKEYIKTLQK